MGPEMGPRAVVVEEPEGTPQQEQELRRRMDAAIQAGWTFRFNPDRKEYVAGRDMHTARTLEQLVEKVEEVSR